MVDVRPLVPGASNTDHAHTLRRLVPGGLSVVHHCGAVAAGADAGADSSGVVRVPKPVRGRIAEGPASRQGRPELCSAGPALEVVEVTGNIDDRLYEQQAGGVE